jgi:hypothetical protein
MGMAELYRQWQRRQAPGGEEKNSRKFGLLKESA